MRRGRRHLAAAFSYVRRGSLAPSELMNELTKAKTPEHLFRLHAAHADDFNGLHMGATWNMLGRLARGRSNDFHRAKGLAELTDHAMRMADAGRLDSWNLSNVSHGAARTGKRVPKLFDTLATAAIARIDDFEAQGLSNTAWAFATAGHDAPDLFDAIAEAVPNKLDSFIPQHYSNVVWAFASNGHAAPAMFDAVAASAAARADEFNPQILGNTSWAYATIGHTAPHLFDAIEAAAVSTIDRFNTQELSNIAWAFAVNDHLAPALFSEECFVRHCGSVSWASAPGGAGKEREALFQLHQWQLWQREHGLDLALPLDLAELAHETFALAVRRPSHFQRQVKGTLEQLLFTHTMDESPPRWSTPRTAAACAPPRVPPPVASRRLREEVVTDEGYSLDLVLEWPPGGETIAVEVDGPSHFLSNSLSPTGATRLKRRQLERLGGWRLVSVPYWAWRTAAFESRHADKAVGRQEYLRQALDECVAGGPRNGSRSALQPGTALSGRKERAQLTQSARAKARQAHAPGGANSARSRPRSRNSIAGWVHDILR